MTNKILNGETSAIYKILQELRANTPNPARLARKMNLRLWLTFFKAETVEELERIEKLEVPAMKEVISAYRSVTAKGKFKELERQYHYEKHNRLSVLGHAKV